ncbi:MAG: class I SAM-dependent methyltransferase [Thermoanaerobaculia bacterium]|nr:class I SAM-dependent methyltransferase [Thermoanaerobaculia bacterium]
MIDPTTLATNLVRVEDGFWRQRESTTVSYPQAGNAWCREVETESFWFRHRNRCIVEAVRRRPPSGPVFDIGGGNGFVALEIQRAGFEVVLVEPGADGARAARERGLNTVVCSSLEDAGFRPGTLSGAGLFDVIEHVPADREFLERLYVLLKTNARLYLTAPAFRFLWSFDDEVAGHHRRYSQASLARVVEAAGFEVEAATYLFAPLPLPIFCLRTLPTLLGRRSLARVAGAAAEHATGKGLLGRLMDTALDFEFARVLRGRRVPFGSTVLLTARRIG